ncbi:helix-turn-helix transcriptional regulator [Lactobacillus sp. ESL0791]|uniref:helix-turn-helix domain-containing protein n=1 Tax=Lactobacillus sp. ESL0791 TaxID=2983234 RepID=UPI0023F88FBF|nr:helix-turn-helix transcriptional regulator [Lactobacillus sp. ESL0791]MDF7638930.1 helix-turn-helix transcriptional regulator [Lactobacillus sp. ESL0791]
MPEFGETIKKLRLDRAISQENLTGDLFDRSMLSKIESGKSFPSRADASVLIHRLGASLEEFEYIERGYLPTPKSKILYQLFNINYSVETEKIKSILNECLKIDKDDDIKRIILVLRAQLLLNEQNGFAKAKRIVQPIWFDYLSNIKIPTITDIYLLNFIAYAFDDETNKAIIAKIIFTIDSYYPFLQSLKCSSLINKASLQLDKHNFTDAKATLLTAQTLAENLAQYHKVLLCKSEIALCDKDKKAAVYYADLLEKIGAKEIALKLQAEIREFNYLF